MNAEKLKVRTPVLIVLLALIISGRPGYYVFQQQTRCLEEDARSGLATIANFKAIQIARV